MRAPPLAWWLVLRGLPRHLRDSVHGDLLEQGLGLRAALGVVLHFQAEPYRDGAARRAVLLLALAGAGTLWLVPQAARSVLAQAFVFHDGFSRAVLWLWGAPALLAALACGALVGRASLLPVHADAARAHLVLLLAPCAGLAATGALQATLSMALLPAMAWLAHANRSAASQA